MKYLIFDFSREVGDTIIHCPDNPNDFSVDTLVLLSTGELTNFFGERKVNRYESEYNYESDYNIYEQGKRTKTHYLLFGLSFPTMFFLHCLKRTKNATLCKLVPLKQYTERALPPKATSSQSIIGRFFYNLVSYSFGAFALSTHSMQEF